MKREDVKCSRRLDEEKVELPARLPACAITRALGTPPFVVFLRAWEAVQELLDRVEKGALDFRTGLLLACGSNSFELEPASHDELNCATEIVP